jgi:hypothetical protein
MEYTFMVVFLLLQQVNFINTNDSDDCAWNNCPNVTIV